MKRHFAETSRPSLWSRFQAQVQQGGVQTVVGAGLVGLLVLAGIVGFLFADRLSKGTVPVEKYHPPHNPILQRLLYHPIQRTDSVSKQQDVDSFLGAATTVSTTSQREPSSEARPRIVSKPLYTAVVGEVYRYELRVAMPGAPGERRLTYEIRSGPPEAKVDSSGVLTWTPDTSQQGQHTIEMAAFNEEGMGMSQTFRVYVGTSAYPLGTDLRGRGMAAALLLGARWAVLPGCIAVVIAMVLGSFVGGLAGYYGQTVDILLTYVSNVTESVPSLVLLFLAAIIFQYNIFPIMAVVGVILFPRVATTVRSRVQSLKARQFVEASRELGLRDRVILWRDIIWYNARPQLLLQAARAFVFAIIVEVTLSYLNLSMQNEVSWGNLLKEGRDPMVSKNLYGPVVLTSLAVIVAVAAFYLLANGIRRRYGVGSS